MLDLLSAILLCPIVVVPFLISPILVSSSDEINWIYCWIRSTNLASCLLSILFRSLKNCCYPSRTASFDAFESSSLLNFLNCFSKFACELFSFPKSIPTLPSLLLINEASAIKGGDSTRMLAVLGELPPPYLFDSSVRYILFKDCLDLLSLFNICGLWGPPLDSDLLLWLASFTVFWRFSDILMFWYLNSSSLPKIRNSVSFKDSSNLSTFCF